MRATQPTHTGTVAASSDRAGVGIADHKALDADAPFPVLFTRDVVPGSRRPTATSRQIAFYLHRLELCENLPGSFPDAGVRIG